MGWLTERCSEGKKSVTWMISGDIASELLRKPPPIVLTWPSSAHSATLFSFILFKLVYPFLHVYHFWGKCAGATWVCIVSRSQVSTTVLSVCSSKLSSAATVTYLNSVSFCAAVSFESEVAASQFAARISCTLEWPPLTAALTRLQFGYSLSFFISRTVSVRAWCWVGCSECTQTAKPVAVIPESVEGERQLTAASVLRSSKLSVMWWPVHYHHQLVKAHSHPKSSISFSIFDIQLPPSPCCTNRPHRPSTWQHSTSLIEVSNLL